jgi:hypothetical protein
VRYVIYIYIYIYIYISVVSRLRVVHGLEILMLWLG